MSEAAVLDVGGNESDTANSSRISNSGDCRNLKRERVCEMSAFEGEEPSHLKERSRRILFASFNDITCFADCVNCKINNIDSVLENASLVDSRRHVGVE